MENDHAWGPSCLDQMLLQSTFCAMFDYFKLPYLPPLPLIVTLCSLHFQHSTFPILSILSKYNCIRTSNHWSFWYLVFFSPLTGSLSILLTISPGILSTTQKANMICTYSVILPNQVISPKKPQGFSHNTPIFTPL